MDRVAVAAGVAKGTLYLYFPSKDALYLGVLSDGLDTAYRTYMASADPKLPVVERMRRSIAVMVEFYDQRRDFLQFFATEEPRLSEARNRIIEGSRERGFNFFATLIEEGIRIGVFTRVDPRARDVRDPGRDSVRASLLRTQPPGLRDKPRARQPDAPIARRRPGAGLQAGASAMIRTIIRRVIRLAILGGVIFGFYLFGRAYPVAARGSLDHQGRRHDRGARGKYHQPNRRAHQATRSDRGRPRDEGTGGRANRGYRSEKSAREVASRSRSCAGQPGAGAARPRAQ